MRTHTYTLSELEVDEQTYTDIKERLRRAGYDHIFLENGVINMNGIGLTPVKPEPEHPIVLQQWEINYFTDTPVVIEQLEGGNHYDIVCEINPERPDKIEIQKAISLLPQMIKQLRASTDYFMALKGTLESNAAKQIVQELIITNEKALNFIKDEAE